MVPSILLFTKYFFCHLQVQREQFLKQQALEEAQQALDEVIQRIIRVTFCPLNSSGVVYELFHLTVFLILYCIALIFFVSSS